eukprot:364676-Chlamydomonas_euryale.AAC.3
MQAWWVAFEQCRHGGWRLSNAGMCTVVACWLALQQSMHAHCRGVLAGPWTVQACRPPSSCMASAEQGWRGRHAWPLRNDPRYVHGAWQHGRTNTRAHEHTLACHLHPQPERPSPAVCALKLEECSSTVNRRVTLNMQPGGIRGNVVDVGSASHGSSLCAEQP